MGSAFNQVYSLYFRQGKKKKIVTDYHLGMIVLLANSRKEDRAVATSLRNFSRTIGGAVGLAGTPPLSLDLECIIQANTTQHSRLF